MSWQLTVILGSLTAAFRSIEARHIGKSSTDLTLFNVVLSLGFVVLAGFSYVFITNGSIDSEAAWNARYYISLMAVGIAGQNYLTLKLFRLLPASLVVLLSLLNPLSVVFIASLFLGESLSTSQIIGAAFLLSAVLSVEFIKFTSNKKSRTLKINAGLAIAIFSALLYGLSLTTEKYLLDRIGMDTYLIFGWGAQLLVAVILALVQYKKFTVPKQITYIRHSLLYGSLLGVTGLLFVSTQVNSDSVSLTVLGASSRVAFTVILAYIMLRERDHMKFKITGVILSIIGMYFLFQ